MKENTHAIFPASNPDIHRAARADHNVVESPNQVVQRAIPKVLVKITGLLPMRSMKELGEPDCEESGTDIPDSLPQW